MIRIYLTSRSARRAELLRQIGVDFDPLVDSADLSADHVDERWNGGEAPAAYVERLAVEKSRFGLELLRSRALAFRPVLAADTSVIVDGDVLGKPANAAEAALFMRRLSGRTHEVRSAVALAFCTPGTPAAPGAPDAPRIDVLTSVTEVRMRPIDAAEIARYCATAEPYDKAGGYAIQGLAAIFVDRIEGSYSGVMGLPLAETAELLKRAGMPIL